MQVVAMFPYPPVSELPGCKVRGLVSHIEEEGGCFWLQREEGAADDISANLTPGTGMDTCLVGDCVLGRWEEVWYRGKVVIVDGDRAGVLFVDYGNLAFLNIKDLKTVVKKDDTKVMAQAIRCRMMEVINMKEWELELARQEYRVKLVCWAVEGNGVVLVREEGEEMLVEGEDEPVVVTHVDHGEVWVTLTRQMERVDRVMNQLGELGKTMKTMNDVKVGRLAAGKFSEDGQMYRCVVEDVLMREKKVVVRYVDFGNKEKLDIGELFELPPDLLRVPWLAVCVKVEGVDRDKLEELVDEENVSVVVDNNLGTFFTDGKKVTDTPLVATLPPPLVLPLHCHVEGEVVHVSPGGLIWFTPASLSPSVDKLMDRLAILSPIPVARVVVDMACTARYSLDGELYRAKVKEVVKDKFNVLFVDFGNEETKNVDEILEIPEDCLNLPAAAIDIVPARSFNREEVEDLLCGKKVSVKLTVEGGREFARVYLDQEEVVFGEERSSAGREILRNIQALHGDRYGLPVGVRTPATLGHLGSVREVWVIPTKVQGKLDKVMDILAGQQEWVKEDHVEVGTLCVTMFSEDQVLYRAMVITMLGVGKVVVRFVDFGNHEEKFVSELKKITLALRAIEHCAVSLKTTWRMEDSLVNREMVEEELGREEFMIELNKQGFATFYRGDDALALAVTAPTDDGPKNNTEDDSADVAVALSYIESVGVVWVTPVAAQEKLDTLMGQLADMGDKLVPLNHVVVGSMVVARYMEDMELYRARVLEVVEGKVTVIFIDYGNYQVSDISSLYKLPTELSEGRVAQAALKVVMPGGEEWEDTEENREVVEALLEKETLTLNKKKGIFSVHGEEIKFSQFLKRKYVKNQKLSPASVMQKDSPSRQSFDQEPECLREESNQASGPLTDLEQVLTEGDKDRQADQSTTDLAMCDQVVYEEEAVPGHSPHKFQASAARSKYSGRWSVGDRVVAFWMVDNMWRVGVIHELFKSEAFVLCTEDQRVKPALVEISHLKPLGVPVDALNKMEAEIAGEKKEFVETNGDLHPSVGDRVKNKIITSTPKMTKPTINVLMTPSLLLTANDEDLCIFARSGEGSRYLQTLVSPENKKLCEKMVTSILSTDPLRMMTNPVSCFLIQKLIGYFYILPKSQQSALLLPIKENFSKLSLSAFGYHVVQAAITNLGLEQRETFILELENRVMLLSLLKSKYGNFVAQACVPFLQPRTVTSLVNNLLGHVVELGCHSSGTFFIQQFLAQWGPSSTMDLLVEDILRHQRSLVHHSQGTYVVQALLKARADYHHMSMVTLWMVTNMEAVCKDKPGVQAIRCLIYLLSDKIMENMETQWSKLLDQIVNRLTDSVMESRPLIIQAACHPVGHMLVVGLTKMVKKMGDDTRRRMMEMMMTYRAVLMADTHGCVVINNLQ